MNYLNNQLIIAGQFAIKCEISIVYLLTIFKNIERAVDLVNEAEIVEFDTLAPEKLLKVDELIKVVC